jgi:hypothetical protein
MNKNKSESPATTAELVSSWKLFFKSQVESDFYTLFYEELDDGKVLRIKIFGDTLSARGEKVVDMTRRWWIQHDYECEKQKTTKIPERGSHVLDFKHVATLPVHQSSGKDSIQINNSNSSNIKTKKEHQTSDGPVVLYDDFPIEPQETSSPRRRRKGHGQAEESVPDTQLPPQLTRDTSFYGFGMIVYTVTFILLLIVFYFLLHVGPAAIKSFASLLPIWQNTNSSN